MKQMRNAVVLGCASAIIGLGVLVSVPSGSTAAEYPTKDIRAIVPWGAGGGADAIVRKIMSIAEKSLPKGVFVENMEGGLTSIGINRVMSSRADGYTVGALTYDSVVTVPWQKLLPGYDLKRLKMVANVTAEPNALMVGANTGYKTFKDIVDAAKKKPGKIKLGIHGLGSMTHLTLLQLQEALGVKFRVITYENGSAGQKEAILSGEVEAAITSLGDFAPVLKSGQARGLVEFSAAPNPGFPEVPISKDVGLKLQTGSFLLFAVPAETPAKSVAVLESALEKAWKSNDFQSWAKQVGVSPLWLGSDKVETWAKEFQSKIFLILNDLVKKGVIKK